MRSDNTGGGSAGEKKEVCSGGLGDFQKTFISSMYCPRSEYLIFSSFAE